MASKLIKRSKGNKTQYEQPASDESPLAMPPPEPNLRVTELFPGGVKDWVECDDAEIDICFIHGLSGNRDSTWTAKGQDKPWPKALLPAELPNMKARIFTYGYDAYFVRWGQASSNQLTDHAMNFLQIVTLDREKKMASNRPLIIVAHSLGGLVAKQAILKSKNNPEKHLQCMYNMIKGIIFMGTPHTGSSLANWSNIPADILGILKSTNKSLLRVLQTNDELLETLNQDFLYLLRTLREGSENEGKTIYVVCFFEELGYPKIGPIVSKVSATFASDPPIGIHANHNDMVKFATPSDAGLQSVAGQLRRWMNEISKDTASQPFAVNFQTSGLDKEIIKSLNDLQATDPNLDIERIEYSKDSLLKDCYEWILNDPVFQKWQDSNTSTLLWIKGNPGKGKTMLMIALARELVKSLPRNPHNVAFFFCQSTIPQLNTAASILRGLIWKLAMESAQLANVFHAQYQTKFNQLNGPNTIYALFSTLLAMLQSCPGAFILVDALDECSSGTEREQLLDLIVRFAKYSKTKWVLSSRKDADIKQVLMHEAQVLSLESREESISKAVRAFIEQKTNELAKKNAYSSELKEEVKKELISKSESTFLWVALACKSILKAPSWKALAELQNLPQGLQCLYARMMEQVFHTEDAEVRHFCLKILRSVTVAFRPLSMEELITIAELPPKLLDSEILDLVELCGSFTTVREGSIYFVHQSAKDYLVGDSAQTLFPSSLQEEHGLIVDRSIGALSKTLKKDMCMLGHPGAPARSASINTRLRAIGYFCSFWVAHLAQYLSDTPIDGLSYQGYFSDQSRVHKFLLEHLLHWFEALSLIGEIEKGISGLLSLEEKLAKSRSENVLRHKNFVQDATRVFRQCRLAIEEAPLQVYYSALIFAPEESLVRQAFKEEPLQWISSLPRTSSNWNPWLQTLEGHGNSVTSVVFSSNGQQLASSSNDGTIRLWDTSTGKYLHTLECYGGSVRSVAFSPDGQQLASGSNDGTVRLWETSSGKHLHTLEGHEDSVTSVAFSPIVQQLASGSNDGTVRLWDTSTRKYLYTLKGHKDWVTSVIFSSNGQQLASGSNDRTIRLWDASTRKYLDNLEGHRDSVTSVAFSPDGQQLASGSDDRTVQLWETSSGKHLHTLKGHEDSVTSVAFSPNGQQLASGSNDGTVRLWDTSSGKYLRTFEGHGGWITSVAFSPNRQQLASAFDDGTVRLWDTSIGKYLHTLEDHRYSITSRAFSPNREQLASGSNGAIRLWDTSTGNYLYQLEGHGDWVMSVAFSSNGQQLASGSNDGTVRLWDTSSRKCLHTFECNGGFVRSVAFSPDGQQLASGSSDSTVRLWDARTRKLLHILEGHRDSIVSIAFAPKRQQLASGSNDGTVQLWDTSTGQFLHTLQSHGGWVRSVAFSPNGQQLASGSSDRIVRLWDTSTGHSLHTLQGHRGWVRSVAFSPNGQQLASGSSDRTVRLWDTSTGECLHTLEGHTYNIFFSPDGSNLVTDFGTLGVRQTLQFGHTQWIGCGLEHKTTWVTWDGKNLIWLPPEFRPVRSAINGDCLIIVYRSDTVYILKFRPDMLCY